MDDFMNKFLIQLGDNVKNAFDTYIYIYIYIYDRVDCIDKQLADMGTSGSSSIICPLQPTLVPSVSHVSVSYQTVDPGAMHIRPSRNIRCYQICLRASSDPTSWV